MKAVLFDVDGTLINCKSAGRKALRKTFLDLHKIDISEKQIEFQGKTDFGIFGQIKKEFNLKIKNYDKVMAEYVKNLEITIKQTDGEILPGIKSLLVNLSKKNNVLTGLLTGNIYDGARIKLEHFKIFDYFSFGVFGDISHDRNTLSDFALRRLKHLYDEKITPDNIFVVGDTVHDVVCGKFINAKTVALGTGGVSEKEFQSYSPDYFFNNLEHYEYFSALLS